jgi:hypothetical protein
MTLDLGIVTGSLSPAAGGLFQSVRLPAKMLAASGTRVTVYGLQDEQWESSRAAWTGVDAEAFKVIGPSRLGYSPAMKSRVISARHDLLHLHGVWFYPSGITNGWRKRHGRPTVISPRGMLDPWARAL